MQTVVCNNAYSHGLVGDQHKPDNFGSLPVWAVIFQPFGPPWLQQHAALHCGWCDGNLTSLLADVVALSSSSCSRTKRAAATRLALALNVTLSRWPICAVTWCADRGWWLETAWERAQLQQPRAWERQVPLLKKWITWSLSFSVWMCFCSAEHSAAEYPDEMPFHRGMQW